MILETLVAASIYSGAVEPKGLLPPNYLDLNPNATSQSLWQSVTGTYEVGEYQRLKKLGPQVSWNEGRSYEGLRISIRKDGVFFKIKKLNLWAGAKYLGSVFHKPYFGWCGAGGCNRGIGSHSLVYRLSQAVGEDRYIDPLKYIIIAFDREKQNYSRVFLSSLIGKERGEGNVTFNSHLDDLEPNNIQTEDTKSTKVQVFAQDMFRLRPIVNSKDAGAFQKYLDEANKDHVWVTHTGHFPDIENDGEMIVASVNGQITHGDRLRVSFAAKDCSLVQLFTTFTSVVGNPELLKIKNRPIKVALSIMETSRQSPDKGTIKNCDPYEETRCVKTQSSSEHLDAELLHVHKFLAGYMAWVDLHWYKVANLKKVLARNYEVAIKIAENKQLKVLSSLDLTGNSWSLNGVDNALDRARAACIRKSSKATKMDLNTEDFILKTSSIKPNFSKSAEQRQTVANYLNLPPGVPCPPGSIEDMSKGQCMR